MHIDTITDPRLPSPSPHGDPLSAAHRRQLTLANEQAKPIRKAARVAGFNGWATAAAAALSAPFALFSLSGLLVFAGLSVVAFNELRGRNRLRRFDPRAATFLGWNQIGLLAIVVLYCLWAIHTNLSGASAVSAELQAYSELESSLGSLSDIETLARQLVVAFYGSVIALSIVFQGINALYYFTRRKHVEAYIANTPPWIRELPIAH
jgi:hypothetical protein